jgi:hypothetical protein
MQMKLNISVIFLLCFVNAGAIIAQQNERVKLNDQEYLLYDLIEDLSRQARFDFSAPADILEKPELIRINAGEYRITDVLNQVEKSYGISAKWKNNHLYLLPIKEAEIPVKTSVKIILFDVETGSALEGVKLLNEVQKEIYYSDRNGIVIIQPENPLVDLKLNAFLPGYYEKMLIVKPQSQSVHRVLLRSADSGKRDAEHMLRIPARNVNAGGMQAVGNPITAHIDTLPLYFNDPLWKFLVPKKMKLQEDSLIRRRSFQAGLIPGIGLNGKNDKRTQISGMALDLLVGLNAGVNGLAIGGLANISRYNVDGAQIGGAANLNGGFTRGMQMAGVYNAAYSGVKGVQISGVINRNAAFFNGMQLSGVMNSSRGIFKGIQLSGLANTVSGSMRGVQLSGLYNQTDTLHGAQIGLINEVNFAAGLQLGLVNISDDTSGFQIGLINLVRKGHRFLCIDFLDGQTLGIRFESGGVKWYNFINAGYYYLDNHIWWEAGWGIGRKHFLNPNWQMHSALGVNAANKDTWFPDWNVLLRLNLDVRRRIWGRMFIYAGPSLNLLIPHKDNFNYPSLNGRELTEWRKSELPVIWWPGFRIGIGI